MVSKSFGLILLSLALLAPATGHAADLVATAVAGSQPLESSAGNKIVVDVFANHLHAVFASDGRIRYTTSTDGESWSPAVNLNRPAAPDGDHPAIAIEGDSLVVVWSAAGNVNYAWKERVGGVWGSWHRRVLGSGLEPAVALDGGLAYVAFLTTDRQAVAYTLRDADDPADSWMDGSFTHGCDEDDRMAHPAVAVIAPETPLFAALVERRYPNAHATCASNENAVGAVVHRGLLAEPELVYSDVRGGSLDPLESLEGLSLSLTASQGLEEAVLAYSDDLGSDAARSRLAYTRGTGADTWFSSDIAAERRHVHVAFTNPAFSPISSGSPLRLAWVGGGSPEEWLASSLTYRDGELLDVFMGLTVSWLASETSVLPGSGATLVGRPQVVDYRRCPGVGSGKRLKVYFEQEGEAPSTGVATDRVNLSPAACIEL